MKLNLCCGPNMFPGWLNVDAADMDDAYLRHLRDAPPGFVWPEPQRELAAAVVAGQVEFVRHDVRKGLDCFNMADGSQLQIPDNSVDAIYIGQAIEHFNRRTEAPALLRECCRVLRNGCPIRLTTPDIQYIVNKFQKGELNWFSQEQPGFYAEALPEDQLSYLLFGASGPDCTAQNYEGHFHCYTNASLAALLVESGFMPRTHSAAAFRDTSDCGMSHSFAIEAVKP